MNNKANLSASDDEKWDLVITPRKKWWDLQLRDTLSAFRYPSLFSRGLAHIVPVDYLGSEVC